MARPQDSDSIKYGEPLHFDKSFKGPLEKRSCTDVICLFIFLIFLGAWAFVAYYAISKGDLNVLLVPTDSQNRKCGIDSQVRDKRYLFFFNLERCIDPLVPIVGCPTPQVCVKECPSETFIFKESMSVSTIKEKIICQTSEDYAKINTVQDAKVLIDNNRCANWYIKSKPLSNRCIPEYDQSTFDKLVEALGENFHDLLKSIFNVQLTGVGMQIADDITGSWISMLLALIVAMITSLLFIAIMRWLATPMVWLSIIGVLAMLAYGVYYSVAKYIFLKNNVTHPNHSVTLQAYIQSWAEDKNTWLGLSIILSVIFLIIFLIVIFLRKRIVISIALIKEGSKAVSSIISSVFFPIFPWAMHVVTIAFAVAVGLYLASVGDSMYQVIGLNKGSCKCSAEAQFYQDGSSCDPDVFNNYCHDSKASNAILRLYQRSSMPCADAGCHFVKIVSPTIVGYFHAVNVVGFFWMVFFISAFGEMVLAATFATWYWTFHKSDVPYFTLTKALGRSVRYHLGTLAFGSLIVTICRLIRVMLEFIDAKLKKYDNAFTKAILCCMKCFFWCLEKFLRFLNKNAYIMCAIHGKNFCSSAKDAFNLLMRNCLRVVTLDKVTDFVFFLSKLLITLSVGTATYFYVERFSLPYPIHYNAVPTVIVIIGTYLITTVFFSVYSMAVDTLFLCFLEDSERNDGSAEKPYFMSKGLMKILGKRNEFPRHRYK